MSGPLEGIRILDLSRVLAGPYCTMMLGDMGADVIKVEPPGGDDTRGWGPPFTGGESAYYLSCNRNKRSIVIDLGSEAGRKLLLRMASQVDVVIENFKLGTMERWGLGYEDVLRPANSGLVYCNISGFGRTGPYAGLPGYDFVVQAMGGLMSITGEPDGPPMKVGVAVTDLTTGMMATSGIMAALLRRERSGSGQRVDLSLLESQVAWLANVASNFLVSGTVPRRPGNTHANVVPYQSFVAKDRELVVAVGNDQQFRRFVALLGFGSLADDPRFATNSQRVINRAELAPILAAPLRQKEAAEWVRLCRENGIPAGPINELDQVFSDPQVLHREMLQEVDHPTAGTVRLVGLPIKFSDDPGSILRPPPLLGEHTQEVLLEFGFSLAEIGAMQKAGAVGTFHFGKDERK